MDLRWIGPRLHHHFRRKCRSVFVVLFLSMIRKAMTAESSCKGTIPLPPPFPHFINIPSSSADIGPNCIYPNWLSKIYQYKEKLYDECLLNATSKNINIYNKYRNCPSNSTPFDFTCEVKTTTTILPSTSTLISSTSTLESTSLSTSAIPTTKVTEKESTTKDVTDKLTTDKDSFHTKSDFTIITPQTPLKVVTGDKTEDTVLIVVTVLLVAFFIIGVCVVYRTDCFGHVPLHQRIHPLGSRASNCMTSNLDDMQALSPGPSAYLLQKFLRGGSPASSEESASSSDRVPKTICFWKKNKIAPSKSVELKAVQDPMLENGDVNQNGTVKRHAGENESAHPPLDSNTNTGTSCSVTVNVPSSDTEQTTSVSFGNARKYMESFIQRFRK